MTHSTADDFPASVLAILKPRWGWVVTSGLVTILFGILAFWIPLGAVFAMTLLFGAYAFADGVLSIIAAVRARRAGEPAVHGNFWPLLTRGVLGVFAGIIVVTLPGLSIVSLTAFAWAMLAIWSIATGVLELIAAVRLREEIKGEWLLGLAGLVSIAVGVAIPVILWQNPAAGLVTMGWLIGFYALMHGVLETSFGLTLRRMFKAV